MEVSRSRPLWFARNLATAFVLLGLMFPFAPSAAAQAAASTTGSSRELLGKLAGLLDTARTPAARR